MIKQIRSIPLIFLVFCFTASPVFAFLIPWHCHKTKCYYNVEDVDFRNTTLHIFEKTFAFHDGAAQHARLSWDGSDGIIKQSNATVRFIRIDDHPKGSKTIIYIVGYQCVDGELKEVFKRRGRSLVFNRATSDELILSILPTHGSYMMRKLDTYKWDPQKGGYVIISSRIVDQRIPATAAGQARQ